MRHPNRLNNGVPSIGTRARKKARRNAAYIRLHPERATKHLRRLDDLLREARP